VISQMMTDTCWNVVGATFVPLMERIPIGS